MTNEPTNTQQVMNRWKMHRNALLELVELLPEKGGSWSPWEGALTTTELIHHLAWTPDFFFSAMDEREMIIPPVPTTLSEARELLKQLTEKHEKKIASYSESDLQRNATIELLKITEPGVDILHRLIGHEAHHKGQLYVYARMLGVKPPFYVAG
ncbi:DinB family protein [Paenibacillus aestuarii]|uniref:DinB family protein n=1 Tax=Paenibacillus aestuarii TaxID=516965 RepID=A0ABW0KFC6_9BACL|nr:DinB family protein [Paenibacillus aestuarii]